MIKQKQKTVILASAFLLTATLCLYAAAPLVYVIPDSKAVHIILGDVPRNVAGFTVARKAKNAKEFQTLTKEPVQPLSDPVAAASLMGNDFSWISRRVGVEKPSRVWRKLQSDRGTALSLCLVSPGLRLALGRTFIDVSVMAGEEYTYRVDLLDLNERKINSITKVVKVQKAAAPQSVKKITAEALAQEIKLTWDYTAYKDSEADQTVSFNIYRSTNNGKAERINAAPVLRLEGWLSYLDSAVENGASYIYFIEPIDLIGGTGPRLQSAAVKPVDRTAPLVPMGLTAVDVPEGVKLLWRIAPEPDTASYRVYRSIKLDAGYTCINTNTVPYNQTVYMDTDIRRGTCYYYKITALDEAGNESPQSGPALVIPRDTTAPEKIIAFTVTADKDKLFVALVWQPSQAPDLAGYHIYRGQTREELTRITGDPVARDKKGGYTDTGFKNQGLNPGDKLVYAVTAMDTSNNEGERVYGDVLIPDNKAPTAVFSFTAKTTPDGAVALSWQPSLSRDLAWHRILRKGDKAFEQIAELEAGTTAWQDTNVIRGRPYTYQVVEVDTSGNQSKPSAAVSVVPADMQPPPAPAKVTAVFNGKGVQLTWEAITTVDLAGYKVYRLVGGAWKPLTAKPQSGIAYHDNGGKAGDSYAVTAVDTSANESDRNTIKEGK